MSERRTPSVDSTVASSSGWVSAGKRRWARRAGELEGLVVGAGVGVRGGEEDGGEDEHPGRQEEPATESFGDGGVCRAVTGAVGRQRAGGRSAVQIQVTDEIEELVPGRLVVGGGALAGERGGVVLFGEQDDALGVDVAGETLARELVEIASEGEGAGRRDARAEVGRVAGPGGAAVEARRRAGEVDLEVDLVRVVRRGWREAVHRRADGDGAGGDDAQRRRCGHCRRESANEVEETRGTAVGQRQLASLDDDGDAAVDAGAGERSEEMLDGLHAYAVLGRETGAALARGHAPGRQIGGRPVDDEAHGPTLGRGLDANRRRPTSVQTVAADRSGHSALTDRRHPYVRTAA